MKYKLSTYLNHRMNSRKSKSFRLFISTLICYLFISSNSYGQVIEINATIDTNRILIGEQISLVLSAKCSPDVFVSFPKLKVALDDKIELIALSSIDTLLLNDREILLTQKATITCFDSGQYIIPSLPFSFHYNNKQDSLSTQALPLYVDNININTSKGIITNIRPNYKAPIRSIEIILLAIIIISLIVIAFFTYKYIKKHNGEKAVFSFKKPPPPPHILATKKLDKLKDDKLWQKGRIKSYYTQLTEILRIYLEGRYHIRTMEQTTEEILDALKTSDFNDNKLYDQLNNILLAADLVKFAKGKPEPNENESALLDAYSFVNDTKPVEIIPPINDNTQKEKEVDNDE